MFLNLGTARLWNNRSVSADWKEWIIAYCILCYGIFKAEQRGSTAVILSVAKDHVVCNV